MPLSNLKLCFSLQAVSIFVNPRDKMAAEKPDLVGSGFFQWLVAGAA